MIKKHLFSIALLLITSWFLFQELYFAFNIKLGISPDEVHHYTLSNLYYQTPNIPLKDTASTYQFGSVSTTPYLYHLILGKSLNLNIFHINNLIYLRILNIILSLVSFYFSFQLIKKITNDKIIQICSLIIQTNILMYVFLSSMVSYDNLINLLSISTTYLLLKIKEKFNRQDLLLIILLMLIGALTKANYLLLIALQLLIISSFYRKIFSRQFLFKKFFLTEWLVLIPILVLTVINCKLYLGNLINYRQLDPSPEKVLGLKNSQIYNLQFQRDQDFLQTIGERPLMNLKNFTKEYIYRIEGTTLGILGHINMIKYNPELKPYSILILLTIFSFLFKIKSILKNKKILLLLLISIFYLLIIFIENYQRYIKYHIFGLGLQGRYIFPILLNFIVIFTYSFLSSFNNKFKTLMAILISILFISGGFFWFISNATPKWYI